MKVLVVDDEIMICEWLQFCISQNPSCEMIGVAHNGAEALEIFRGNEADLVVTDIRMPVMDGLELLHALHALNSHVKVVMLTAFSDFDLVRQALRDGAAEYLLKTEMQNDTLQELLKRTERELNISRDKDDAGNENVSQIQSVVSRILRKDKELSREDLDKLHECNIRWRNNGLFALAVWKKDMLERGIIFPKESQARHVAGFDYTDRVYMIVGNFPRTLSVMEKSRQLAEYARQVRQINDCMVGVSMITDEMQKIAFMTRQASCSLAEGFYMREIRVYEPRYSLVELLFKIRQWKSEMTGVRVRIHQAQGEERYKIIKEFLEDACKEKILDIESVCKLCIDAFDLLEFEARERGTELQDTDALRSQLTQCVSAKDAEQVIDTLAGRCSLTQIQEMPKSKNIQLALEYINRNYASQLSLEQVAAQVYLNPDYFSRAFKSETGHTFVNYLTDVRMQHAISLLENTALRVQSIAQQVGYYNASYFSTAFKKKYGMSPYEYRRKRK